MSLIPTRAEPNPRKDKPRTGRRRSLGLASLALSALIAAAGGHLGWYSGERPWQVATGWDEIPSHLRAPLDTAPWRDPAPAENPVVHWLGHSGFVIEWHGRRLLIDPNSSRWCTLSRRRLEIPGKIDQLGPVDAVLVSHAHFDHLDLPTLRSIPRLATVIVPAGSEDLVELPSSPPTVVGLRLGERRKVGALEIVAVPATHNGGRLHPLRSRRLAVGYVVRAGSDAIYYAGDTGAGNDFASLGVRYRPRLAILPIGAFSPPFPIGRVHLNPEQAVEAALALRAEVAMPAHFGTFTLSLDSPRAALPRFARAAQDRGVRWIMPRLLGLSDGRSDGRSDGTSNGASSDTGS